MVRIDRRAALRPLGAALLILPALPACAAVEPDPKREQVLAEWARYKAAWNRRDAQGVGASLLPDGTFTTDYSGGTLTGGVAVARLLDDGTFAAFPDFQVTTVGMDLVGSRSMFERWIITGTWSRPFKAGPLAGAPASGKRFTARGASYYEWDNGKIKAYEAFGDQLSLLSQIGALGAPPPRQGS